MTNRQVDLSAFTRKDISKIAVNDQSWNDYGFSRNATNLYKNYSEDEIKSIIESSSLSSQRKLSYDFYISDGFYTRIIIYYATLLTYSGLLIPNPKSGKTLSNTHKKKYFSALEFLEGCHLQELLTRISLKTLIYGSYYGIIHTLNKDTCVIFDLPIDYCRSRFKDIYGNDIIEFNLMYFDSILDEEVRREALNTYPSIVSDSYKKYHKNKLKSSWIFLPSEIGIYFSFYENGSPLFLSTIPSTIKYDKSVDTERERELEEIRKILVQKIPHMQDGQLLFEPEEALEMHQGAVNMMRGNKNLSVLTTYADVDAIVSKTSAESASNALEKMLQNVYANAGVSSQLFAPTGSQALLLSIKNDISLMMILGNKYGRFISYIVNDLFSTGNLRFSYLILPVTEYTRSDFITDAYKLAQGGYSFLLPAVAIGLSQLELTSLKDLENNILKLKDVLIPLSSSYTESTGKVGAPQKKPEEKAPKTIQNETSLERQGGSE